MTSNARSGGSGPVSLRARSHHPLFAVAAVMLGTFLAAFDSRLFTIGLADLRGGFSLSFDEGAWLATAALAPQILIAPAVAWLATVLGIRRLFGVPSLVYAIVSLIIPFTRSYDLLLILHVVRGLLLGVFVPATLMIIFRNLAMPWWLPAIALYAFRAAFTLNSGVALGGHYVDVFGWQWLYWQDVAIAPLMAIFAYLGAPHESVNRALIAEADWGGMLLFGSGMTLLYIGLDQGNRLNWLESGIVVAAILAGGCLLLCFLINERLCAEPWASTAVLRSRNITLMLIATVMFSLTSISNTALVPNFLTTIALLRPEQTGQLLLLYCALPLAGLTLMAVYMLRRVDARIVMIVGFGAFSLASIQGTGITPDWRLEDFMPIVLLQAVGYAFTFLPIIMVALANSNPARATAFSAYIQVLRLGGAQIGLSLMTTWLRVREQTHSNLIGQHVESGESKVVETLNILTQKFQSFDSSLSYQRALSTLGSSVQKQANVLSYVDGFWLTFWAAIVGLIGVAFMIAPPPGPFTPKARPQP